MKLNKDGKQDALQYPCPADEQQDLFRYGKQNHRYSSFCAKIADFFSLILLFFGCGVSSGYSPFRCLGGRYRDCSVAVLGRRLPGEFLEHGVEGGLGVEAGFEANRQDGEIPVPGIR